jgi:DNA-directed RNA polymerase subunit M/transcription elongation factor TFIIS
MLTIFVFKQRLCPDDKTALIVSGTPDNRAYTCPKCKKIITKANPTEYNRLGVRIQGSTRKFLERDAILTKDKTLDFEKVLVPENPTCQKCRNDETRSAQATANREKKIKLGLMDDMQEIPKEVTDNDIIKYEINMKLQTDANEKRKAEAYEKQKIQREIDEAERKARLKAQLSNPEDLLVSKDQMVPLLDPESLRVEQEAKAKDIRIEDYKKNLELKKKLKEDIAKTDEEIAKLKKQLEEAKKNESA